jgi:hypothetical protein
MESNPLKLRQKEALEKTKQRIKTAREEKDKILNPKFNKISDLPYALG